MTAFVLVHGAWGGSWGFHKVRPILNRAGHQVFTPSLTGVGEREHLSSPEVGLGTHITDVCNMVHYEDLDGIVLLGFSYGGMVVSGALDRIGDRVSHLVYLDAFVPDDGQSVLDLTGSQPPSEPADHPDDHATDQVDEASADISRWTIAPIPRDLGDPAETQWVEQRRSPQPIRTFTDPVTLTTPIEDRPYTLSYIKATADPNEAEDSPFHRAAARARASDRWRTHDIESNHMVPLMKPAELCAILLTLIEES